MKIIRTMIIIAAALLLTAGVCPAYADGSPVLPQVFYGSLTIDGQPAPAGTIVEARGAGVDTGIEYNPINTSETGLYGSSNPLGEKLLVQGDIVEGSLIKFYINGSAADQTALFQSGGVTRLDLNLSTTSIVQIAVVLQGSLRPPEGWIVPLTIKFFTPGTGSPVDVLNSAPEYSFSLTTAKSGGTAIAQASGVLPGEYDISVITQHCLINVRRGVEITNGLNTVNLGTLLEGNSNDDYIISIQDFGILAKTYGKQSTQAEFDARADFNRDGLISISDFGLLAANYGKYSPVEVK